MDAVVHFDARGLGGEEKALCSHIVDHPESECPLCVYTIDGSIPDSDESLADLERKTVFQRAYSLWSSLHNSMNCYALSKQIADRMKGDFIEACGELEPWMQKINTEVIFNHFVYHDRQKSSLTVLIDQEIGNAGALMRCTERATLMAVKRARVEEEGGLTALDAARGCEVVINPEGLRNHVVASENYRQWIKLRLHSMKYC